MVKMINVTKTRALFFSLILACFLCILIGEKCMNFLHVYDFSSKKATLSIDIKEEKNRRSYGNEMRIISITADDEEIDLSKYATDNWIWHEEWGYILYQEGNTHFEIEFDRPLHSLQVEYVCQGGSGNADLSINNNKFIPLRMYSKMWENKNLSIRLISSAQKVVLLGELIFLLTLVIYLMLKYCFFSKLRTGNTYTIYNKIGMFDLAKGIGICAVVVRHTVGVVISDVKNPLFQGDFFLSIVLLMCIYVVIPMFFIASGYGFRVEGIIKTVKKQLSFLVKPYVIVWALTFSLCILHFIISSDFGKQDIAYTCIPFLFASTQPDQIFDIYFGTIGPLWFVISLCFSWICLNVILNCSNEIIRRGLLVASVFMGYGLSRFNVHFFCLMQIFNGIIYLYIGYYLKKQKILMREEKVKYFGVIFIAFLVITIINGYPISITENRWGNSYLLATAAGGLGGIVVIRWALLLDSLIGKKLRLFKRIGRQSFYIFFIHSLEYLVMPWDKFMNVLPNNLIIRVTVLITLRTMTIYAMYKIFIYVKGIKIKKQ